MATDGTTTREFSSALADVGRAGHALADAIHRNNDRQDAVERALVQLEAAVAALVQVADGQQELAREKLRLEDKRLDLAHKRQEAKEDAEREDDERTDAFRIEIVRSATSAFVSKGGLLLCGAAAVIAMQTVMGKGPLIEVLHVLVEWAR